MRELPPSGEIVYVVVILIVIATIYGKYLISKK
jgi:hypothetical protein